MNPKVRTLNEQTLRTLMHVYMSCTLLSFFLLCFFVPLPLPGSNTIFYLFVSLMLFPETETVFSAIFALLILLTMFIYPVSLLASYILALVKKWFRFFGILMAINVLIGLSLLGLLCW